MKQKIVVFYHDDHDGFGAAWAAWRKFKSNAQYVALNHPALFNQLKPYLEKRTTVYFVDFCPEEFVLKYVESMAQSVIILDHHISRKDIVLSRKGSIFDNDHSGAFLAWKFFHPRSKIPLLIRYIQDFDLWQWKLPGTEALLVALPWEFDFLHWNQLFRIVENKKIRKQYLQKGITMLQYKQKIVESIAQDAEKVRFGNIKAFAVDAPKIVHSEIGHVLASRENGVHVGILYRLQDRGTSFYISLRSDGKVDVSKIAKKYGGGGHKEAAAFRWPASKPLPFKFVKSK